MATARKRREGIDQDVFNMPVAPLSEADIALFGEIQKVDQQLATVDSDGAIRIGNFVLGSTGLTMDGEITHESWQEVGTVLFRLKGAIQWLIGDWALVGEREWGATYKQIAEAFGYEVNTLYNFRWVANSVEFSLRRENLYFDHHKLVASLPPEGQAYWLNLAEENGWTISQMRKAMKNESPALPANTHYDRLFTGENRPNISQLQRLWVKVGQGDNKAYDELRKKLNALQLWINALEESLDEGNSPHDTQ